MGAFLISGQSRQEAMDEAIKRCGLPAEALIIEETGQLGELIDDRMAPVDEGVTLRVSIRPQYIAERAGFHLVNILKCFDDHPEVRTVVEGDSVKLKVRAGDSAILIGRQGQTLEALQHLVNRMACPSGMDAPYVALDIENYRERRVAQLEKIARRAARKAVDTQSDVELEVMSRADRKIVHMALRSNRRIRTASHGEEGSRYIVISAVESGKS